MCNFASQIKNQKKNQKKKVLVVFVIRTFLAFVYKKCVSEIVRSVENFKKDFLEKLYFVLDCVKIRSGKYLDIPIDKKSNGFNL